MNIGALRHNVTVQSATETRNADTNEVVYAWAAYTTRRAEIGPLSGRELFQAQQVYGLVSHQVTMRYVSGLTPKMRILFGTRALNIVSIVNVDERNIEHRVYCTEVL